MGISKSNFRKSSKIKLCNYLALKIFLKRVQTHQADVFVLYANLFNDHKNASKFITKFIKLFIVYTKTIVFYIIQVYAQFTS